MKLKIKGALFHCGRCRKDYSNLFGHVCVTRLDRRAPAGKTRLTPGISASFGTCGTCHKPLGSNPLTHTCTVRTDFRKRRGEARKQEAAEKRAAARRPARKGKPEHLYEACRDEDCQRTACRAYREGREEGYQEGYEDGYAKGYEAGYGAGFTAGFAAGAASAGEK